MDHAMPLSKGIIINLDRLPVDEWGRIFDATGGSRPIFKIGTTIQKKSIEILSEIRNHGEMMIDTRLGEYLPDVDECIEMYKPYDPWAITFQCGNDFVMRQAHFHRITTTAVASVRVVGTDEECRRRNGATCNEVILQLVREAYRQGLTRILCSMRELSVIRTDTISEALEFIVYGNYPLWNMDPGAADALPVATPADALRMGADFIIIGSPVTVARSVTDPVGLVIEAYQEFQKFFVEETS
ncbi:MAG: hypothetical protein GX423_04505 [Nitrospiraceae bacterium]|jgi:hypothetical protein|nr:hypothetical protein [Nitrospiraceae bacterium]